MIGIPNLWSAKGLVTKLTPHRFHRWVYRIVFKAALEPHKTYLRITPNRVERLAATEGMTVVHRELYSGASEEDLPPLLRRIWGGIPVRLNRGEALIILTKG